MALCHAQPCARARAFAARGRTAVSGRRRPALVAAGERQGHPHAHLRRQGVAGLCRRPLSRGDRRSVRPGRTGRPSLAGRSCTTASTTPSSCPITRTRRATLYEHCARALDASLAVGEHGLPLMGTGDWNDGMNRVGEQGKGESVWLGWFLHESLVALHPIRRAAARFPARRQLAGAHGGAARGARGTRLGRRLVSPRLFRRRLRRWARPPTASAASIPSRSPGP